MANRTNDISELRGHLFEALEQLKKGKISEERARAMSNVAQTIVDTAKVEVEYLKVTEQVEGSGFLPVDRRKAPQTEDERKMELVQSSKKGLI